MSCVGICAACGAATAGATEAWLLLCPTHWQEIERLRRDQAIVQLRRWIRDRRRPGDRLTLQKTRSSNPD